MHFASRSRLHTEFCKHFFVLRGRMFCSDHLNCLQCNPHVGKGEEYRCCNFSLCKVEDSSRVVTSCSDVLGYRRFGRLAASICHKTMTRILIMNFSPFSRCFIYRRFRYPHKHVFDHSNSFSLKV